MWCERKDARRPFGPGHDWVGDLTSLGMTVHGTGSSRPLTILKIFIDFKKFYVKMPKLLLVLNLLRGLGTMNQRSKFSLILQTLLILGAYALPARAESEQAPAAAPTRAELIDLGLETNWMLATYLNMRAQPLLASRKDYKAAFTAPFDNCPSALAGPLRYSLDRNLEALDEVLVLWTEKLEAAFSKIPDNLYLETATLTPWHQNPNSVLAHKVISSRAGRGVKCILSAQELATQAQNDFSLGSEIVFTLNQSAPPEWTELILIGEENPFTLAELSKWVAWYGGMRELRLKLGDIYTAVKGQASPMPRPLRVRSALGHAIDRLQLLTVYDKNRSSLNSSQVKALRAFLSEQAKFADCEKGEGLCWRDTPSNLGLFDNDYALARLSPQPDYKPAISDQFLKITADTYFTHLRNRTLASSRLGKIAAEDAALPQVCEEPPFLEGINKSYKNSFGQIAKANLLEQIKGQITVLSAKLRESSYLNLVDPDSSLLTRSEQNASFLIQVAINSVANSSKADDAARLLAYHRDIPQIVAQHRFADWISSQRKENIEAADEITDLHARTPGFHTHLASQLQIWFEANADTLLSVDFVQPEDLTLVLQDIFDEAVQFTFYESVLFYAHQIVTSLPLEADLRAGIAYALTEYFSAMGLNYSWYYTLKNELAPQTRKIAESLVEEILSKDFKKLESSEIADEALTRLPTTMAIELRRKARCITPCTTFSHSKRKDPVLVS